MTWTKWNSAFCHGFATECVTIRKTGQKWPAVATMHIACYGFPTSKVYVVLSTVDISFALWFIALSNSAVNPYIYFVLNWQFRTGAMVIFRSCRLRNRRVAAVSEEDKNSVANWTLSSRGSDHQKKTWAKFLNHGGKIGGIWWYSTSSAWQRRKTTMKTMMWLGKLNSGQIYYWLRQLSHYNRGVIDQSDSRKLLYLWF